MSYLRKIAGWSLLPVMALGSLLLLALDRATEFLAGLLERVLDLSDRLLS